MLPGLICWQIVGSSGSIGKSVKPSGEPSVVQVQQSEHGQAANGADGRKQPNQGTHRHGEIAHGRILKEGLNCFRPRHGQLSVVIRTPLHVRTVHQINSPNPLI